jgi:hypothetical protein
MATEGASIPAMGTVVHVGTEPPISSGVEKGIKVNPTYRKKFYGMPKLL